MPNRWWAPFNVLRLASRTRTRHQYCAENGDRVTDYLESFADARLIANCIHCAGPTETRDHVPSRILLDEPYPDNLPILPACAACNCGYSLDEEYFACLVECARTGSVDAAERPKIQRILRDSPSLAARITQARAVGDDGQILFKPETERVRNIVLKLARGHAAFELSELKVEEPSHVMFVPLCKLETHARRHFETAPATAGWPEVGSRAMQRMALTWAAPGEQVEAWSGWIEVQTGRYRYLAVAEAAVMVRFVASEYLACEVIWDAE